VTSIVGNEVGVLKIAVGGGRRASSTPSTEASTTANPAALSLGGATGNRAGGPGGSAGGGFVGGGPGGPVGGQTDRTAMLAQLKAMSTGQETIIIPIGIKMMKFSVDGNTQNRTAVEANLTDITADKMITVWLNSGVTNKKVAEFVLIN
jgi:hypothetical protein